MNQNVLEYLSSLAKTENKEFILPNIEIHLTLLFLLLP
jgi:hypothetical protein